MFFCCASKEDLKKEKAGDAEQDDVACTDDMPVKAQPVLPAQEGPADVAAGPGSVAAPKAAAARAEDDAKEKAKKVAQQISTCMKEGETAFGRSDWDKAVAAYTKVIELNPKLSGALAGRGGAHLRKGELTEALTDLDKALDLESENLFALRDRAEARLKLGDMDGALDDFNKKLSLAPGDGRALCGRGEVRIKKGDKEGALADFQLAMRLSYPGADKLFREAKGK